MEDYDSYFEQTTVDVDDVKYVLSKTKDAFLNRYMVQPISAVYPPTTACAIPCSASSLSRYILDISQSYDQEGASDHFPS